VVTDPKKILKLKEISATVSNNRYKVKSPASEMFLFFNSIVRYRELNADRGAHEKTRSLRNVGLPRFAPN